MPVIKPIIPFIRRRKPKARIGGPTPPAALVLVAASLDFEGSLALRLTFDRGVDADAMDPSQITAEDPTGTGFRYQADTLVDQPSPQVLLIELAPIEPASGSADVMSATADTGIVAIDDGGTWPGVTDLELPYP